MNKAIGQFLLALGFFSRIPLPAKLAENIPQDEKLASAVVFFPVAGLALAIIPALVWVLAVSFFPASVAAMLTITAGLLTSGALHEDGLADCADGLGGAHNRERALEIMRDSRIGTYGTLALIASFGLRAAALANLAPLSGLLALFIAHCGARSAIAIALQYADPARQDGLGRMVDEGMPENGFRIAAATAFAVSLLLGALWGILAMFAAYGVAWLFLTRLNARLGGYTGDGLGAMEQLAEITILCVLAGAWA